MPDVDTEEEYQFSDEESEDDEVKPVVAKRPAQKPLDRQMSYTVHSKQQMMDKAVCHKALCTRPPGGP